MRMIVIPRLGGPDVLTMIEVERPTPRPDEVLIKLRFAGLTYGDVYLREGTYRGGVPLKESEAPLRVGGEGAGTVAAIGANVTHLKEGDEVVYCECLGSYAEYASVPDKYLALKPANLSFAQAAAVPIAALTALQGLRDQGQIQPGQKVLIQGASGGVGTFAVQLAKAFGTEVTAVCSPRNLDMVRSLGADHVINYKTERFEGVTRKLTGKKGVDVVFEHVGGEGFNGSLLCLKRGGRLVTCGSTAGPTVTINLMQLFQQQYKILGSFGASMRNIRDSLSKIAAGMAPIIDTEVELADFERGLTRLESRQVFGKVIVKF